MDFQKPRNGTAVGRMHRRVKEALEASGVAPGLLVVAVSGGPDSLALLYALHHLREGLGLRLHGAHLDHGLRGDASKADSEFVAQTFRRLGIAFTLEEADVSAFRRNHRLSLEDAAREVRHAFLAEVAVKERADAIALGHTSDDQAETVLMHIIRGSGLTGLRGMQMITDRISDGRTVAVVRPLLKLARRDTADYCRAMELEPCQDESNLDPKLMRNRVRMELLPLMQQYNPAIRKALERLASLASQGLAYVEAETEKVWPLTVRNNQSGLTIDRTGFSRLHPALRSHLLRRAVLSLKGDLEDLEQSHIDDMARLMAGPAGRSLDLPGVIRFHVSYTEATLSQADRDPSPLPTLEGQQKLRIPGETLIPGWRVEADLFGREGQGPATPDFSRGGASLPPHSALFDLNSVGGPLLVRSRRNGDRFQPLGMSQSKKLQDFMVDSKIPRDRRDRVPLVVSPKGIAWVVGWRIAEWAKVQSRDTHCLELRFEPR